MEFQGRQLPGGRPWFLVLLHLMFFVSGASALVYEVAWKHLLGQVFGNSTYAVSVVISVFMGGMAAGTFVFGRVADRTRAYLVFLSLLQAAVAASAALTPAAIRWLDPCYTWVFQATHGRMLLTLAQALGSALVLFVPTFLMGATLPMLSRLVAQLRGRVGAAVGGLYGANTLGAATGAFATGFVLIRHLGIIGSVRLASGVNLAVAFAFLCLHMMGRAHGSERVAARAGSPDSGFASRWHRRLLVAAMAVSGFVSFSYEIAWTRLLAFRFEGTVYAFSLMLTAFLLGLGMGSAAVGLVRPGRPRACWVAFGLIEGAIGLWGLAQMPLFVFFPHIPYSSFSGLALSRLVTSVAIVVPPTALMGAAFPIACQLYSGGVSRTGSSVGALYLGNTCGAVLGGLLTGFMLIERLGTDRLLSVVSLLILASGSAIILAVPDGSARRSWLRVRAAVPALFLLGLALWLFVPDELIKTYYARNLGIALGEPGMELRIIDYEEGVESVALVVEPPDGERVLTSGVTVVAGTSFNHRLGQAALAHVPMLLHGNARRVLHVGFGTGNTAGILASYAPDRLDSVEISPAVVHMAAKHFSELNRAVLHDPRLRLIMMDAAAYLRHTRETYDVIASDSSWPHLTGSSALYSREYFVNARKHLRPGGMMSCWVPLKMPLRDFKSVLRTFHSVFPHAYIWSTRTPENEGALLIGAAEPLRIDARGFLERFNASARDDLSSVGLGDPAALLSSHLASVEKLAPWLTGVPLNTADRPFLQFLESEADDLTPSRQSRQVARSLKLLLEGRDPVMNHIAGLDSLPDGGAFAARLRAMDLATRHFLRADTTSSLTQQRRDIMQGIRLAPTHPYSLVWKALRRSLAAVSEERIKRLGHYNLARLSDRLYVMGYLDRALTGYRELARRDPTDSVALLNAGVCALEMGDPAGALELFRRGIRFDPGNADALVNAAVACMRLGQPEAAEPFLEKALKLQPRSADILAYMAIARAMQGRAKEAEELFLRSLSIDPDCSPALWNLAALLERSGRPAEAARYRERLKKLNRAVPLTAAPASPRQQAAPAKSSGAAVRPR